MRLGTKSYGIERTVRGSFSDVVGRVKRALKEHGFGTLSEIDVQAILREKIGKEIPGYTILGVCNPQLAAQAIDVEANIGVFLPCTVLVRQEGDAVAVIAQDPELMEAFLDNPALAPISAEARRRLVGALDSLGEGELSEVRS